jgi:tRNA (guanine37-N1)-methyltransferase
MRIHVVTLFAEILEPLRRASLVGKAVEAGRLSIELCDLRPFGIGRHLKVDDTPYGGGSGMVMRVDCVVECLESIDAACAGAPRPRRVLLTPQGARLDQRRLGALAAEPALTLVCGRYEGFDERIRSYVDEELSLGDFVLAGGEVAAMAVIEGVARLLPGVLGNEQSTAEESHSLATSGLLEYPQYTRPVEYRGARVPEVLVGGNHARIAAWRSEQSLQRTTARRPDLVEAARARLPDKPKGAP